MAKKLVEGEKRRKGFENTLYRIKSMKRAGFSNAQIAKKLGVNRTTVWRWLNNKTKPDVKTVKYKKSAKKFNRYYRKNTTKITQSKRQIGLNKLVADKISLWEYRLSRAKTRGSKEQAQGAIAYYKNLEGMDFEDLQRRLLSNKTAEDWESWRGDYETVKGKLVYNATTV